MKVIEDGILILREASKSLKEIQPGAWKLSREIAKFHKSFQKQVDITRHRTSFHPQLRALEYYLFKAIGRKPWSREYIAHFTAHNEGSLTDRQLHQWFDRLDC